MKVIADNIYKRLMKTQLKEVFDTDSSLGNAQDILSGISVVTNAITNKIPKLGAVSAVSAGLAAAVNMARGELDRTGIVPSASGNLDTQQKILLGRAIGIATKNSPNAQHMAQSYALFGGVGTGNNPALMLGGMISGQSKNSVDDVMTALGSSEFIRKNSDKISSALGIPVIPGISTMMTTKVPTEKERSLETQIGPNALDLMHAANNRRR